MKKMRVALVGCGRVGTVHAEILSALEEVELVACCDIKPERAEEFSRKYGGVPVVDYRELLQRSDVDVLQLGHAPSSARQYNHRCCPSGETCPDGKTDGHKCPGCGRDDHRGPGTWGDPWCDSAEPLE